MKMSVSHCQMTRVKRAAMAVTHMFSKQTIM